MAENKKNQFINKEIIINLLKDYEISDIDLDKIYLEDNFIKHTQKLCDLYLKLLEEGTDNSFKMAHALGANIIFNLRKFVMKKDIILLLGATDAENNKLKISEIPLTELLNNSTNFSITKEALVLKSSIEKYENLNKQIKGKESAVWKKILDASQLQGSNNGDFNTKKGFDDIENNKKLYQRLKKDTNIYYSYNQIDKDDMLLQGKNERIYSYYKIDGEYQFFNRGWLFEHFMNKWNNATNDEKIEISQEADGDHPVKIAIGKIDSIPGYKGGDFRAKGKDYQAKYGNTQIITVMSIAKVMKNIKELLNKYNNERAYTKEKLSQDLIRLFTDEKNLDLEKINQSYENVYEDIIKKMGKTLSKKI